MIKIPAITYKHWLFPAGNYYIGDPCYVVSNDEWLPLLERTGYFGSRPSNEWDNGLFEYKMKPAFAHGTAWGDGSYYFNGTSIGVDAGLISLIPVECIEVFDENLETLYCIKEFVREFEVWYDDGVFHFGTEAIDTN